TDTNVGVLTLSWDDPNQNAPNGQSVPDGATIFSVRLALIGTNGSPPSAIQLDGSFVSGGVEVTIRTNNNIADVTSLTALNAGQLIIGEPNTPPFLTAIPDMNINEEVLLSFATHASD